MFANVGVLSSGPVEAFMPALQHQTSAARGGPLYAEAYDHATVYNTSVSLEELDAIRRKRAEGPRVRPADNENMTDDDDTSSFFSTDDDNDDA